MKIQKMISIDVGLAIELKKKRNSINASEICQNALMVACELVKPTATIDIKARLIKIESEKLQLTKLLDNEKTKLKEISNKIDKEEFRKEILLLKGIRRNNPNMFVSARKSIENKYNLTNAEIMKQIDKV